MVTLSFHLSYMGFLTYEKHAGAPRAGEVIGWVRQLLAYRYNSSSFAFYNSTPFGESQRLIFCDFFLIAGEKSFSRFETNIKIGSFNASIKNFSMVSFLMLMRRVYERAHIDY